MGDTYGASATASLSAIDSRRTAAGRPAVAASNATCGAKPLSKNNLTGRLLMTGREKDTAVERRAYLAGT